MLWRLKTKPRMKVHFRVENEAHFERVEFNLIKNYAAI